MHFYSPAFLPGGHWMFFAWFFVQFLGKFQIQVSVFKIDKQYKSSIFWVWKNLFWDLPFYGFLSFVFLYVFDSGGKLDTCKGKKTYNCMREKQNVFKKCTTPCFQAYCKIVMKGIADLKYQKYYNTITWHGKWK